MIEDETPPTSRFSFQLGERQVGHPPSSSDKGQAVINLLATIDWPATIGGTLGRIAALALLVWLINRLIKWRRGE